MAQSIVMVPSTADKDFDFLAFSFNGKHSWDDFGIYRTIDGDRYNENLAPIMQDKTAEVPGGDGLYYFGTTYKQRDFNVNIAFDNMSEEKFREMHQWLNGKEMGDLWFEESPYKIYTAKPTGTSSLKTICFNKNGERVYKGEGNITFTAYWPYAHTPDKVANTLFSLSTEKDEEGEYIGTRIYTQKWNRGDYKYILIEVVEPKDTEIQIRLVGYGTTVEGNYMKTSTSPEVINNALIPAYQDYQSWQPYEIGLQSRADVSDQTIKLRMYYSNSKKEKLEPLYSSWNNGMDFSSYSPFSNRNQWKDASGFSYLDYLYHKLGNNVGELPAPFVLTVPGQLGNNTSPSLTITVGKCSITIPAESTTGSGDALKYIHYKDLTWDSKTGIVSACRNQDASATPKPIPYSGNSLGTIPVGGIDESTITIKSGAEDQVGDWKVYIGSWKKYNGSSWGYGGTNAPTLNYHYWYY